MIGALTVVRYGVSDLPKGDTVLKAFWNRPGVFYVRSWCALHITRKPVNCGKMDGWYYQ